MSGQLSLLHHLYRQVKKSQPDFEAIDRNIMILSLSLIRHNMFRKERSVLIYYTNILGWNDTAHVFRLTNKYTPYLAEIQFCIHIIILEKALPMMDRDEWVDNSEVSPLEMFLEY